MHSFQVRNSHFNPHSHEGSDVAVARYNHTYSQDFNPHSHEGSDKKIGVKGNLVNISIHTPMKGVTVLKKLERTTNKFQSTLP